VLTIVAPGVRKNSIAHATLGIVAMYFECPMLCAQ
jgi:hypothetical protein